MLEKSLNQEFFQVAFLTSILGPHEAGVGSFMGKGKRCNCGAYDMEDREAQRLHTEQNFDSQRPLKVLLCSNSKRRY